jgi:hypothetical protein
MALKQRRRTDLGQDTTKPWFPREGELPHHWDMLRVWLGLPYPRTVDKLLKALKRRRWAKIPTVPTVSEIRRKNQWDERTTAFDLWTRSIAASEDEAAAIQAQADLRAAVFTGMRRVRIMEERALADARKDKAARMSAKDLRESARDYAHKVAELTGMQVGTAAQPVAQSGDSLVAVSGRLRRMQQADQVLADLEGQGAIPKGTGAKQKPLLGLLTPEELQRYVRSDEKTKRAILADAERRREAH